jgi:hypothetical protein
VDIFRQKSIVKARLLRNMRKAAMDDNYVGDSPKRVRRFRYFARKASRATPYGASAENETASERTEKLVARKVENALRLLSMGRKNWLFFGLDHGGEHRTLTIYVEMLWQKIIQVGQRLPSK